MSATNSEIAFERYVNFEFYKQSWSDFSSWTMFERYVNFEFYKPVLKTDGTLLV